jgi:uncharacterized membrane protein
MTGQYFFSIWQIRRANQIFSLIVIVIIIFRSYFATKQRVKSVHSQRNRNNLEEETRWLRCLRSVTVRILQD